MKLAARGGEKAYQEGLGAWPPKRVLELAATLPLESAKVDFETAFAEYLGVQHAIAVNSGTTALDLAVEVLTRDREGPIVSSCFGHPASVQFAARNRTVEYVDIDPDTLCMSVSALREGLETHRPSAVVVTHVAGTIRDMPEIAQLCASAGVPLIEDASHAHGSAIDGRPAGSLGDIGCFSLHATKNLPAGEGGVLTTNSGNVYRELWRLHDLGRDPGAAPYHFSGFGGNARIHPAGAALALAALQALDEDEAQRCETVDTVIAGLPDGIACLGSDRNRRESKRSYHFLPLIHSPDRFGGTSRKRMALMLTAEGIACNEGWTFLLPELSGSRRDDIPKQFPNADRLRKSMIWIDHRLLLQANGGQGIVNALGKLEALLA